MTSELFIHRGQTGATFGTYTTDSNISHFTNDRLELQAIGNSVNKKILWGKTITVSVYYLNKFNNAFPGKTNGVWTGSLKYTDVKFFLSSESNNLFDIAQRITNRGSATAVYAFGYANTDEPDVSFESYLKEIDWNFDEGHWDFVTWSGDRIESNELVLYFSEPSYITFENNTDLDSERTGIDITDASLTVLGVNTVENGYGYVVSEDGALLPEPRVIVQEDIDLPSGKSIQIMFPGAVNQNYVLTGRFTGDSLSEYESVVVERTDQPNITLTADEIRTGYSITGKTSSQTGATHSIMFGGKRPVCKITEHLFVNESDAIQFCEDHDIDPADIEVVDGKYKVDYEQPFMRLNDAKDFAETYLDGIAEVEMLIDYVIPVSDVLVFETVNSFTITTAARNGGTYNYRGSSTETTPRALVSRDPSNKQSFILIRSATAASNFTLRNLILDGKNISGKTDGGALKSLDCDVNIENTEIKNFRANEGGGIYIQFARGNGTLTVTNSSFTGCVSESNKNRNGGGAIWTNAETMSLSDSLFEKCTAYDQGGAVFHRIDSATEYRLTSASYIDNCIIKDCNAHAAGGVELDSYNVTILNSHIENCHGTQRNAGGANVYIQPDDPDDKSAEGSTTYPVYVRVENSEFIDCSAVANGGGMRIVATEAVVKNSIFRNNLTSKNSGGGIAFTNIYGTKLEVIDCQFTGNSSAQSGGAIYDFGKQYLLVDGTTITGNSAGTKGGGVSSESNVTLRNDTKIENNRVRTALATDAGGIHILNGRTLTIGDAAYKDDTSHIDKTTVRNNVCNGDVLSDIRLPEVSGKNETTSISVLCQIGGDLYVANAKEKGDQFGSGLVEDLRGLTEQTHVFKSDDGKLFGAIDRLDTTRKKVIWYGPWICKITDTSNNILFIDPDHKYPAVYDSLDVGTTSVNNYSAFGVLKANSPALYTASGQKYNGKEYLVQMIVPYYTVNKYVTSNKSATFKITLMTASKNDSIYPYEGENDAATLERGLSLKDSTLLTAKLNMTIKDIARMEIIRSPLTTADCSCSRTTTILRSRSKVKQNSKM